MEIVATLVNQVLVGAKWFGLYLLVAVPVAILLGRCIAFGAGKPIKPLLRWPR